MIPAIRGCQLDADNIRRSCTASSTDDKARVCRVTMKGVGKADIRATLMVFDGASNLVMALELQ